MSEAAWKAVKERVSERNAQTRKEGKKARAAFEAQQVAGRRARERRQMEELLRKQDSR
jgi:hypothetical protein